MSYGLIGWDGRTIPVFHWEILFSLNRGNHPIIIPVCGIEITAGGKYTFIHPIKIK